MALSISRRSFMKCVGITAFATATGTLMTGCAPASIVGGFGGSISLSEDGGTPLANISLTGMDWSPFNVSISDIERELGIDLPGVDFNFSGISSVLGFGCAMPKGRIENTSDKTLVILPYFTTETLDEVFQDLVVPRIGDYKEDLKVALGNLLSDPNVQKTVADALNNLIQKQANKVGGWLGALVAVAQKVNWNSIFSSATMRDVLLNGRSDLVEEIKSPITKKLVQFALKEIFGKESLEIPNIYNWGDDLKTPILNGIHDLIDTTLPSASDLFRILMVQGVFDKQAKESKTDQFLNAAAAGYTHLRANTPLMVNTIDADGAKAGVLGFPAYRNWTTLDMHFTSRKLALSLDEGYELDWNTVAPLVVEAVIYVIYKDNLASLGTMLLDVIDQNGLLKKMNFSIEGVTARTTVSFNEATF